MLPLYHQAQCKSAQSIALEHNSGSLPVLTRLSSFNASSRLPDFASHSPKYPFAEEPLFNSIAVRVSAMASGYIPFKPYAQPKAR